VIRTKSTCTAILFLCLILIPGLLVARPYQFESIFSKNVQINEYSATPPTINRHGTVAYITRGSDWPLFDYTGQALVVDKGTEIELYDLSLIAIKCCTQAKINDNQFVAVVANPGPFTTPWGGIYLISGPFLGGHELLVTSHRDGVLGDFKEIQGIAINNHNVVAAKVRLNSGQGAIIKVDTTGYTIIDTEDSNVRFTFSSPAINDAGVVAYKAQEPSPNGVSVFIGDGANPVQKALPNPSLSSSGDNPDINESGLIALATSYSLFKGINGVVSEVVVDGASSPFTTGKGPMYPSLNNAGDILFSATTNDSSGLWFGDNDLGDDPLSDKLIQAGDSLFGGIVSAPLTRGNAVRFVGVGGFNDPGQAVFRVSVVASGITTSHVVRATPTSSPSDSDGDGVPDDQDICPGGDDNVDSDSDFVPDFCDSCPLDAANDSDGDGSCDSNDLCLGDDASGDTDGDGLCEDTDPCIGVSNSDADADGVCDEGDVCIGDDAFGDTDGDLICEDLDICVGDDAFGDTDGDLFCDDLDVCPFDVGNDADGDGICETDDNCEATSNAGQTDTDGDGYGDACDVDDDGDGIEDANDNCPLDVNPGQEDLDINGVGDECQTDFDEDGDGVGNYIDQCLGTTPGDTVNEDGCSIAGLSPCLHPPGVNKWKNHGAYVRSVAHTSQDFVDAGLISEAEKDAIVSASGQSQCGATK